ncbi:hypothetical protein BDF20DRAFT_911999 [Mycotypha africana]|uniref:uncharacterized protein n=1 Tax=Mycotypha africana TaxID=64632 RepID=UPI0023018819|nr:uncharacterized protein BDF20DRAFT_911999 [Mycotypha africana]KAI8981744.1 hypothetical protein BDF20DRAFT_911999 [Mycotypha africana]
MSHPITNNMEFIKQVLDSDELCESDKDNDSDFFEEHSRRRSMIPKRLNQQQEESKTNEASSKHPTASKWHSILRKMSMTVQKDDASDSNRPPNLLGTLHEATDNVATSYHPNTLTSSDFESSLMLQRPFGDSKEIGDEVVVVSEDVTLPTVEEVAIEGNTRAEEEGPCSKTRFFENPFAFDAATSLSTDDSSSSSSNVGGPDGNDWQALHPLSIHPGVTIAVTKKKSAGSINSICSKHRIPVMESRPQGILLTDSPEAMTQSQQSHETPQNASNKAKLQWSRTFEKIKVVNSFGHHRRRSSVAPHLLSKQPLAPYYPSAFIPGYLSLMCKDEHGRKAPPILFDALNIAITDSEIDHNAAHRLWTFRIELQYGDLRWVIHRTIIEFYNLHLTLKFKYISGYISEPPPSFPSQLAHLTNAALTSMRIAREQEAGVWREVALKRRDALESYLKTLIQNASLLVNYELCEFLELGALSISKDMGWKGKEGYLEYIVHPNSSSASTTVGRLLPPSTHFPWDRWQKEWLILRDSYIAFCKDIGSTAPSDVLLFDKHFKVARANLAPAAATLVGSIHPNHFFTISNATRRIEIKAPTTKHFEEWLESLEKVQKDSPWVMNHRFGSYAPIRKNAKARWFIDGHDYYEAVIEAILSAKSEIFIEDWWLSPQLFLRRPPKGNEEYRLDRLLKRKASEGVMIYIVIYKNVSVALPLDSQHTRDWLQNVHPNIIVQRHANLTASPFWAHHEKILVIDYRLAFVGGLDLCFGRYDTPQHTLTDFCSGDENEIFPGQDYSNPRLKDFHKVSQYDMELINKNHAPRMPWHDIHTAMVGPPARDIARHFVQRWNFIKSNRAKERTDIPFLLPKGEYVANADEIKFRGSCRVQLLRSSAEWSLGITREYSIYNAYMECIFKAKHFIYIENQFFITTTSPHDKLIKNKIGQAIVERIKRAHRENQKFKVIVVIPVAPGFEGDFVQVDRKTMPLRSVAQYQYRSISRGKYSVFEQLRKANIPIEKYIGFYSLRNWGKINNANLLLPASDSVPNSALQSAISTNSNFLPLSNRRSILPKKRGLKSKSSGQSNSNDDVWLQQQVISAQLSQTQQQQQQSQQPLQQEHDFFEQQQYNDGRLNFVTEQVYIHSKLMIVDDRIVICGSANLNDRSQLGNRDSEIAAIIEDSEMIESRMNGQPYKAAKYALTLRMQLFKEHLGLLKNDRNSIHFHDLYPQAKKSHFDPERYKSMTYEDLIVMDPLLDDFYSKIWNRTAENNTLIYRDVFRCVPDDTVHNVEQHRQFIPDPTRVLPNHIAEPWNFTCEQIEYKLNHIQGHLVQFPTEYLRDISMTASVMQEAVPPMVFT